MRYVFMGIMAGFFKGESLAAARDNTDAFKSTPY